MHPPRTYDDSCAAAHALDLVGERWALLVIRELAFGPKRFTDLHARLRGASTSVLTQRVQELVAAGVVTRRKLPPPAGSWVYELTEWGRELEPVLVALGRWGRKSTSRNTDRPSTPAAVAFALKARFDPGRAQGVSVAVDLQLADEEFRAVVTDGRLTITAASGDRANARISVGAENLRALLRANGLTERQLADAGVTIEGDVEQALDLLDTLAD